MPDSEENSDKGLECPLCGSTSFRRNTERAELLCRECGTVIEEEMIEESAPEQRAFTSEEREKIKRTGAPITYTKADRGMSTEIGSGSLRDVSPSKRGQYYRMKKWQRRLDESRQRRMKFALGEMERLVAMLKLPKSVLEEAGRLYEKALEQGVVKGRRIEHIAASLIYVTARNHGVPRTMSEIADEAGITERELGKTYRYVARELDLRIVPVNPEDFIPRFGSQIGMTGETQARARRILENAREEELLAGRSPDGIVAAALYLASKLEGEEVTQQEIAEAVGVTEVTVRKGYQNLVEGLELEEEIEKSRSK